MHCASIPQGVLFPEHLKLKNRKHQIKTKAVLKGRFFPVDILTYLPAEIKNPGLQPRLQLLVLRHTRTKSFSPGEPVSLQGIKKTSSEEDVFESVSKKGNL
jgi:hypothetical protein